MTTTEQELADRLALVAALKPLQGLSDEHKDAFESAWKLAMERAKEACATYVKRNGGD